MPASTEVGKSTQLGDKISHRGIPAPINSSSGSSLSGVSMPKFPEASSPSPLGLISQPCLASPARCSEPLLVTTCLGCRQTSSWYGPSLRPKNFGMASASLSMSRSISSDLSSTNTNSSIPSLATQEDPASEPFDPQATMKPTAADQTDRSSGTISEFELLKLKGARISAFCAACYRGASAGTHLTPPGPMNSASTERFPHRADRDTTDLTDLTSSSSFSDLSISNAYSVDSSEEITTPFPPLDHSDNSSNSSVDQLSTSEAQSAGKLDRSDRAVYIRLEDTPSISSGGQPFSLPGAIKDIAPAPASDLKTLEEGPPPVADVSIKKIPKKMSPRPVAIQGSESLIRSPNTSMLQSSRSKSRLRDPSLVGISESDETGEALSKDDDGATDKGSYTSPELCSKTKNSPALGRGASALSRSDSVNRGESLRMMLRQAKIPTKNSEELEQSRRRILSSREVWESATMGTSQDHLRSANFSSWQSYQSPDVIPDVPRPLHQHKFSVSSMASFEDASLSRSAASHNPVANGSIASRSPSNLSPRSVEHSPARALRSASPPSERRPSVEGNGPGGLLSRRPSLVRSGQVTDSGNPRLSPQFDSRRDYNQQEVLQFSGSTENSRRRSGSSQRSIRPAALTSNILSRFANHYSGGSTSESSSKILKRRPNTATGSLTSPSLAKSSPRPGYTGQSPNSAEFTPSIKIPSPSSSPNLVNSEATQASKLPFFLRPATATGTSQPGLSVRSHPGLSRPMTAQTTIGSPSSFSSNEPQPLVGLTGSISGLLSRDEIPFPSFNPMYSPPEPSYFEQGLSIGNSTLSNSHNDLENEFVSSGLPRSVPPTPSGGRFPPYRAGSGPSTENVSTQHASALQREPSLSNLPPEDFHSKSRNFTLAVLPRPSSESFRPGQRVTLFVRLSSKIKAKKYSSISLSFLGAVDGEPEGFGACQHAFLRVNYPIYPTPAEGVKVMGGNKSDSGEWRIDMILPQFANCRCRPGPLPLPNSGPHQSGNVTYCLQLSAEKKQLLSSSETVLVKCHFATSAEARYQVTTQPLVQKSNRGRIDFAGGYLGSIEEHSLCHQVYYQSADRLRIGYQLEVVLSKHSFLPDHMAEELCQSIKVDIRNLCGELSQQQNNHAAEKGPGLLHFRDHRSKILIKSGDEEEDLRTRWIIKGYLEIKNVLTQMQNLRATLEYGAPVMSPSASSGSVAPGTVSQGLGRLGRNKTSAGSQSSQPPFSTNTATSALAISNSSSNNGATPAVNGSNASTGLQMESERQNRLNNSQIFIIATWDHQKQHQGALSKSIELTSLIGPDLISRCALRRLGEEMMRKVIIEEKMKRVQEVNDKNRTNE